MATKSIDRLTIPDTPEAFAEFLVDDASVNALAAATPTERSEFLAAYNRHVNKADVLAKQINEQVATTMAEFLQDHGAESPDLTEVADQLADRLNPMRGSGGSGHKNLHNPKALGAGLDKDYTDATQFFRNIWHNTDGHDADVQRFRDSYRNAFSSDVPSEGGFLIPERLRAELLRVSLETAIVRPRARVIPMDSLRVPFPAIDSTSNASSVYGGIVGYWTEEGASLTASQASFGRIVLDAKKLTAYTEVPNELLSDSGISFMAFINDVFPEALSFYEDYAFFQGTGTGEPKGFINADAAISVTKESGQAADTIVWENIVKMFSRMLPSSLNRAVWIASIDSFPELATMSLNVGTGGSAIWLNNGVAGPPMTILGRPVIFTEKSPVVGDAGDLNFVDLSFYLIGDRQAMSAKSSEHHKFQNDVTAFRIIERVDGRPWLQSAITPKNSGSTLSPFVKIAARA